MTISDEQARTRKWTMLLHLSQLGTYILPFSGLVAPLLIWHFKKKDIPALEAHGRAVANWIISALIYGVVFGLLATLAIGAPLLIALAVVNIAFAIIGGIKALGDKVWTYPLSYPFIRGSAGEAVVET